MDLSANTVRSVTWTKEEDNLIADWSDIAQCYRWLHDRSYKLFYYRNLGMSIPGIILSTLAGAASVSLSQLTDGDPTSLKYGQIAVGAISLFTGLIQTLSGTFEFAKLAEGHRVSSISWGKIQRKMAVELQLAPKDRMHSIDFINFCRQEIDKLIEQSPSVPESIIKIFDKEFDKDVRLKQPDICGGIEHTKAFENKSRAIQVATEAALHLKLRKRMLREDILPDIDKIVTTIINTKYVAKDEVVTAENVNYEEP